MRKGSITMFILIGIIAVVVIGMGLFASQRPTTVSDDLLPIERQLKGIVEDCLRVTLTDAMDLLLTQSGYIDTSHLEFLRETTESDGVQLTQDQAIPYWWYLESANDCLDCTLVSENAVTAAFIEQQLGDYIANHTGSCVRSLAADFGVLKVNDTRIETKITLARDSVFVQAHYPVIFELGTEVFQLSDFAIDVPVRLGEMIQLARDIWQLEQDTQFLEELVFTSVLRYSGVGFFDLPPIYDITHEQEKREWTLLEVREQIKDVLAQTVPLLYFNGTSRALSVGEEYYESSFAASMTVNGLPRSSTLQVQAMYFDWPVYLHITPQSNGKITPSQQTTRFPMGISEPHYITLYEFFYDFSFPVVFQITDPVADANSSTRFYFAMEANIRDNLAAGAWVEGEGTLGHLSPGAVDLTFDMDVPEYFACSPEGNSFRCPETGDVYSDRQKCAESCSKVEAVVLPQFTEATDFCNEAQHVGSLAHFDIRDAKTDTPLTDVDVRFTCGAYAACSYDQSSKLRLPVCLGGRLVFRKNGYIEESVFVDSRPRRNLTVNVDMWPHTEVTVKARVIELEDLGSNVTTERPLKPSEIISLQIYNDDVSRFIVLNQNESSTTTLGPGSYTVQARLVDQDGITIPAGCMGVCTKFNEITSIGGDTLRVCEEYAAEPKEIQELKPFLAGGARFVATTGLWNVSFVADNSTYLFTLLRIPEPTCSDTVTTPYEELGINQAEQVCFTPPCRGYSAIQKIEELSLQFRRELEPQLI